MDKKSTGELSTAEINKQLKELEKIASASNFSEFYKSVKAKTPTPNIKASRSRDSSTERTSEDTSGNKVMLIDKDGFVTPLRRIAKPRQQNIENQGTAGIATSNNYEALLNEDQVIVNTNSDIQTHRPRAQVTTQTNNERPSTPSGQKNSSSSILKPKSRPPPINVYTTKMKELVNLIIAGNIPEGDFWIRHSGKEYISQIGHSSSNCTLEYKCVKCGNNHGPIKEGGKCEITENSDKSLLKCTNCGKNGHTASYLGCEYLTLAQDVKNRTNHLRRQLKQIKMNKIYRTTNPDLSFVNIASSKQFSPLPRQNNTRNPLEDHFRPATTPSQGNSPPSDNNPNIFSFVENMMNQFKNSFMSLLQKQFQEISNKITENSTNIEFLMSQCDYE
ncbi:hypothetical protein KQX54_004861 [Cotesia glomerata]|uniref:Uncharacterized protein n=1 Tax=Cotesia glomerata TaxID=32391 RepID=A0AAV7IQN2_COTGL|nr:hypothetical protein KQX54_004861 [Cotesia glomerata]